MFEKKVYICLQVITMEKIKISKESVQNANRVLIERRSSTEPVRNISVRLSAQEINSAYKKVLSNGKKV